MSTPPSFCFAVSTIFVMSDSFVMSATDRMHFASSALGQIIACLFKFLLIAAGNKYARAFFEELPCGLEADAARATGDDRAAAFDSQIHLTLPLTPSDTA